VGKVLHLRWIPDRPGFIVEIVAWSEGIGLENSGSAPVKRNSSASCAALLKKSSCLAIGS
jgi:hypothetical protein